jgi:hypothetical protein
LKLITVEKPSVAKSNDRFFDLPGVQHMLWGSLVFLFNQLFLHLRHFYERAFSLSDMTMSIIIIFGLVVQLVSIIYMMDGICQFFPVLRKRIGVLLGALRMKGEILSRGKENNEKK